jgi:hypothetical protein
MQTSNTCAPPVNPAHRRLHHRRLTGSFERPGSLLPGRYDQHGVLRFIGQTHRVRAELRDELARLHIMAFRGDTNWHPWPCPLLAGWAADLTNRKPLPYLQVEPSGVSAPPTGP